MPAADAMVRLLDDPHAAAAWGRSAGLADPGGARRTFNVLAALGVPFDLLGAIADQLAALLPHAADADRVLVAVERFFAAVRSPLSTAALCDRDPQALATLVKLFAASPYLAEIVIADTESWEEVRLGQGRPEKREALAAALKADVEAVADPDDVLRALRGESPEVEQQAERQLERNRDQLLQDLGLARQRELDELRGRIDRLERLMRQRGAADIAPLQDTDFPPD